jgi:plasmid stabilization system protein ParE
VDEIRFHPEALEEYQIALEWYHARSSQASYRFEAEVERVLASVAADPDLFPKFDEAHRFAMLRRFPFSLIYESRGGQIEVMAMAHSRRQPGYWRDRS